MIRAPDFHLYRQSARWFAVVTHRGSLRALASLPPATTPTMRKKILWLAARLRRLFNAGAAAAIARQAALAARQARDDPRA